MYKDVSYVLDEDAYSTAEFQDIIRKRFVRAWDGLVDGFKVGDLCLIPPFILFNHLEFPQDTFTEGNYRAFFTLTVEALVRPWEKHILGMKFSEVSLFLCLLQNRKIAHVFW